jgi:hypothetical protein
MQSMPWQAHLCNYICGRGTLEIAEPSQVFSPQMIDPSGSIIRAASVCLFLYLSVCRQLTNYLLHSAAQKRHGCDVQVLEDVSMVIDLADFESVEVVDELTIPLRRMPHNSVGSTFSVLQREEGSLAAGTAVIIMHFKEKSRDPATGEVEEEGYDGDYDLEGLEVPILCSTAIPLLLR